MSRLAEDLDVYAYRKGWPRWALFLIPILYPTTWAIIVYRFGFWVVNLRFRWLRLFFYLLYFPAKRITEMLTCIEISEHADIAGGLFIAHLGGVVISHHAILGEYVSIHQGVTIGGKGKKSDFPVIGDRVYLSAGAKIIGPVRVGNDVVVGANAVVVDSVPDDAIVGGIPATVLNYESSRDYIHFRKKGN